MASNTDIETTKQDDRWNWYIWECIETHPSMRRAGGLLHREGCGYHNLRKTKKTIGDDNAQAACVKCPRRKRLSPQNVHLRLFKDKMLAKMQQDLLNKDWKSKRGD